MADRIFAGIALAVIAAYGIIAFTALKAPFQYDPLGPESWPRLLSVAAFGCCLAILVRPDPVRLGLRGHTGLRLLIVLVPLVAYAALFEPLGFILSTAAFCTVVSLILGGSRLSSAAFGLATGVLGYGIGAGLLGLNLPAGLLSGLW